MVSGSHTFCPVEPLEVRDSGIAEITAQNPGQPEMLRAMGEQDR
jgi:hypothetical protein